MTARRAAPGRHAAALLAALLLPAARPLEAEVLLSEQAALERAFPGLRPERRVLYLTKEQVNGVESAAGSKLPSPVVTTYEARAQDGSPAGRACLDTHVVRTMPETVLTALEPDGRLRLVLVLRFDEPPDYLPRERWLRTFAGKSRENEIWPGRGVPRVTGSTLTVQALSAAVRRCLAIDAVIQ